MTKPVNTPAGFQTAFNVSRETIARLQTYEGLLRKWNPKINLVSGSTLTDIWHRHFADSAQLWQLPSKRPASWLDIGSGAGFPGLVIATLAAEASPKTSVTLIESDQRKSAFLRTVARELGLDVTIRTQRIEAVAPENADILSARALTSLPQLLEYAEKHRNPSGECLFPKGARVDSELTAAASSWHISCDKIPSITDPDAVILRIGEFHRA